MSRRHPSSGEMNLPRRGSAEPTEPLEANRGESGPPAAFRESLVGWAAVGLRQPRSQPPLEPVRLRQAVVDMVRLLGDRVPREPSSYELDETVRALDSEWSTTGSIENVGSRHLRRAAWAFYFPRNRPDAWLAYNRPLLQAWLRWLGERGRPSAVVALLQDFLAAYPRELPAFEEVRRYLQRRLVSDESPRAIRWRERCDRFGLLEHDGPERLLRPWWDTKAGFDPYLSEAGLGSGLEASRFVEIATERLLTDTEAWLRSGRGSIPKVQRVFEWLERDGELRFGNLRVGVATTFLRPFLSEAPKADLQQAIIAFLCRTIGDPRIRMPRWHDVPEGVRNVLLRWLVGASLEDFFRVLDRTADAHWMYRKAFWSAYLGRRAIDDAWIVLGPDALRIVRQGFREGAAAAKLRMGTGVLANHSVLLMRIGGLTIAEWSHNGTCRIWKRGNKTSPKFYDPEYVRRELVEDCDWFKRHGGAPQGTWQEAVAEFIAYQTGISVPRSAYMPRTGTR